MPHFYFTIILPTLEGISVDQMAPGFITDLKIDEKREMDVV